ALGPGLPDRAEPDDVTTKSLEQIAFRETAYVARLAPQLAEAAGALQEHHLPLGIVVDVAIRSDGRQLAQAFDVEQRVVHGARAGPAVSRSEEHTSELQSRENLVCRLLLEKKKQ